MRFVPLALVALWALLPVAMAQAPPELTLEIAPLKTKIKPLASVATTNFTVRGSCAILANTSPGGTPLNFWLASAPPWAQVTVSPSTTVVDPTLCEGAEFESTGRLVFRTTADAPAFRPTPVRLGAAIEGLASNFSAEDEVAIEADYFSILDARAEISVLQAPPQSQAVFPVRIENLGNANTRVTIEFVELTGGANFIFPPPVTLQSKQQGDANNVALVNLVAQTPYENGYMNEISSATVRILASYALDPTIGGDDSQVSLILTTKGWYVPGPGLAVFIAILGGAALYGRAQSRP